MSGPSGVGKGSVVRELLRRRPELFLSVSATTREPRRGEVDEVDYLFVSRDEFDDLVRSGALLEWAEVFGSRYGTPAEPIRRETSVGRSAILEIDVQGASSIRERDPDAFLVFLMPPSEEELERRLRERGTEEGEVLDARLEAAEAEMRQSERFDRVVVNDDLDRATDEVLAIIDESS